MNPLGNGLPAALNPTPQTITAPAGFSISSAGDWLYNTLPNGQIGRAAYNDALFAGTGVDKSSLKVVNPADMERLAGGGSQANVNFGDITKADFYNQLKAGAGGQAVSKTYNNTPNLPASSADVATQLSQGPQAVALPFNGGAAPQTAPVGQAPTGNIADYAAANPYQVRPGEDTATYNARIAASNPNLPAPGTTSNGVTNNATLSSANLGGASSPNYVQPAQKTPTDTTGLYTTPPTQMTEGQQQQSDLTKILEGLYTQEAGRAGAQVTSDASYGIPAMQQTIKDLTAQRELFAAKAAQINAAQQPNEGVTSAIDARQRTEALRQNSINDSLVASQLNAIQGNISTAQTLSNQAISNIYDPIEAQIKADTANLQLIANDPKNTVAEKNQAQAQLDIKNQQADAIAQQKQNLSDVLSYANQIAANYGANPQSFTPTAQYPTFTAANTAMRQAHSVGEVAQIAAATGLGGAASDKTLLTPTEAAALGVSYGTTRGQAAQMGLTPGSTTSDKEQNALEQQYRQALLKELSNRSGGLGLQDAKVNQAIHLKALFEQFRQPDGTFAIPAVQYSEIAMGLANLVAPTGQVSDSQREAILQKSAAGDIAGMFTYVTGIPQTGSTQAIFKNLYDSIERQGNVAEDIRNQDIKFLHGLAPTGLEQSRIDALEKNSLASFRDGQTTSSSSPTGSSGSPWDF